MIVLNIFLPAIWFRCLFRTEEFDFNDIAWKPYKDRKGFIIQILPIHFQLSSTKSSEILSSGRGIGISIFLVTYSFSGLSMACEVPTLKFCSSSLEMACSKFAFVSSSLEWFILCQEIAVWFDVIISSEWIK